MKKVHLSLISQSKNHINIEVITDQSEFKKQVVYNKEALAQEQSH